MAGVELGSAYISILPSTDKLAPAIRRELQAIQPDTTRAGERAGKGFAASFGGVLKTSLKGGLLAGVAGVSLLGGIGVKTAADAEQAQIAFSTMLGSAQKAKKFIADLNKFAAKTPFDMPGLTEAASSLISAGISADKVIPIMTSLGNATSGMGTGAEGIKRATVALQQMNAAGKITGEDLNQLRDAGIPVFDLLSAATGKSKKEVAALAQAGKLGATELDQLMKALQSGKGLERFNGLMEKQSHSLTGMSSTLKDTLGQGLAKAIKPLLPLMKEGLGAAITGLTPALAGLGEKTKDAAHWAKGFAKEWKDGTGAGGKAREVLGDIKDTLADVLSVGKDVGSWLVDHKGTVLAVAGAMAYLKLVTIAYNIAQKATAAGSLGTYLVGVLKNIKLVSAVTKTWTAVQWLLNAAMDANPLGLIVLAIGAVVVAAVLLVKHWDTVKKVTVKVWDTIKHATQVAAYWVVDKVLWLAEKMLGAMEKAFGWAPKIGPKIKAALNEVKGFREGVNRELDAIRDEDVNIKVGIGSVIAPGFAKRNKANLSQFGFPGGAGGGGRIPSNLLGGMGGGGIIPRVKTPGSGAVHGVATDVGHAVTGVAGTLQKDLQAKADKMGTFAGMGAPGSVLPRGSYSIGVPINGYPGHTGQDLPAPIGTPVTSPWAGRVTASYDLPGTNPYNGTPYRSYGRLVKVAYANGMELLFAHLSARLVQAGQPVRAGQIIGRVGMNGNATGPHLHLEERRGGSIIDPRNLGVFDNGGVLEPGAIAVNLSKRPEAVYNHKQFQQFADSVAGGRGGLPRRVELVVEGRRMSAMMREIAEDTVSGEESFRATTRRMGSR